MIIAKAAFVLRKQLFNDDEIFNGGLTRKQQMASIPQVLHQLIKLLSEGGTCNDNTILLALQILQMISQLIRYNAVKHQRLDPVTHVRYSSSNQPPLPVAVGLMVSMRTSKKSLVNQLTNLLMKIYAFLTNLSNQSRDVLTANYVQSILLRISYVHQNYKWDFSLLQELTTLTLINLQLPQGLLFLELL